MRGSFPVDGRPPLPDNVETWLGDPRGRWEGNTLVVETRNFVGSNAHDGRPHRRGLWQRQSEDIPIVERFTRVGPETISYQVTIADPETWTRPFTIIGAVEQDERADLRVPVPGN